MKSIANSIINMLNSSKDLLTEAPDFTTQADIEIRALSQAIDKRKRSFRALANLQNFHSDENRH